MARLLLPVGFWSRAVPSWVCNTRIFDDILSSCYMWLSGMRIYETDPTVWPLQQCPASQRHAKRERGARRLVCRRPRVRVNVPPVWRVLILRIRNVAFLLLCIWCLPLGYYCPTGSISGTANVCPIGYIYR